MYRQLLQSYIEKLKKEDIIKYIENNNYDVSNKDIDTIYFYIKNYYQPLLTDDSNTWNQLKKDVSPNTYNIIEKLVVKYQKYKELL